MIRQEDKYVHENVNSEIDNKKKKSTHMQVYVSDSSCECMQCTCI